MASTMTVIKRFSLAAAAVLFLMWFRLYNSAPQVPANSQVVVEESVEADVVEEPDSGKSSVQSIVEDTLRTHRVVIFSKSYCGYSMKAKHAMANNLDRSKFHVVELDQREDGYEIQQFMQELTGGATVPRVFIDGKFIGGGDDTAALDSSGKLAEMLKEKGIL